MITRKCVNCGKEIKKKKTVSARRYSQRKYCSQACYREWMRVNRMGWWKGTDIKNRKFANPDDKNAIEALKEFGYI